MNVPLKLFYFIRHGETDWNHRHILMGQRGIPLNLKGLEQAEKAASLIREEKIEYIASSPLLRAKKTAEIIATSLQKPLTILNGLKECSWGVKEGCPIDEGK